MTTSTPQNLVQCPFCLFVNVADPEKPLCGNCSIHLSRDDSPSPLGTRPEPESEPRTQAESVGDTEDAESELDDLLTDEGHPSEPDDDDATSKTKVQISKRQKAFMLVMGGVVSLAVAGTAIALGTAGGDAAKPAENVATQRVIEMPGWQQHPVWTSKTTSDAATLSRDGKWVGVINDDMATVLDAKTGDTVATQPLGRDATTTVFAVGDMLVAADADAIYLWTGDTAGDTAPVATNADAATNDKDKDKDKDVPGSWLEVAVTGDASLSLRGDNLFVVGEVGASYQRVTPEATLANVAVPTPGAVPVSSSSEQIVWATNKGVAHLTTLDGVAKKTVTPAPVEKGAKLSRWIGGDASHVYVAWRTSTATVLAVHSLEDGSVVSSHPISEDDQTAATLATRDGATIAVADLLIDTTTGATIPVDVAATSGGGDQFLAVSDTGTFLVSGNGDMSPLEGEATPLLAAPKGALLVEDGDELALLKADKKPTAQKKKSEQ